MHTWGICPPWVHGREVNPGIRLSPLLCHHHLLSLYSHNTTQPSINRSQLRVWSAPRNIMTLCHALYLILGVDHCAIEGSFFSLQVCDAKFLNQHSSRGYSDLGTCEYTLGFRLRLLEKTMYLAGCQEEKMGYRILYIRYGKVDLRQVNSSVHCFSRQISNVAW